MNKIFYKKATNANIFSSVLMDNVTHVTLERSSNCDTVSASRVTNLLCQAIILNSGLTLNIFLLYLRQ